MGRYTWEDTWDCINLYMVMDRVSKFRNRSRSSFHKRNSQFIHHAMIYYIIKMPHIFAEVHFNVSSTAEYRENWYDYLKESISNLNNICSVFSFVKRFKFHVCLKYTYLSLSHHYEIAEPLIIGSEGIYLSSFSKCCCMRGGNIILSLWIRVLSVSGLECR